MGVRTALVDRARVVRREAAGQRVRGTTPMADVAYPWFKCRLELNEAPEDGGDPDLKAGRRKAVRRPRLMLDVKDEFGDPVDVKFSDRLQIESLRQGENGTMWRISVQPGVTTKKRRAILMTATLERVLETQFEER